MRRFLSMMVGLLVVTGSFVIVAAAPAEGATYTVTSANMCGGPGTFQQALHDANAHPGPDTISFTPGLKVDAWTCNSLPAPIYVYPLAATDSVTIVGNGATIVGGQVFINYAGLVNDPSSCPSRTPGTMTASPSIGFLEVGTYNVDNSSVSLTVGGLNFSGMPSLFLVERNASLTLTDSTADKTMSLNDDCSLSPIQTSDGNVTLARVPFHDSSTPALHLHDPSSMTAVVAGFGAGTLAMDSVSMVHNFSGRAVMWSGSSAKIVSSQFYDSGGLWLNGATSQIVNTVWRTGGRSATDRIISTTGTTRIDASTFFWGQPACEGCASPSLGLATAGAGTFDLHSTALGAGADYPGAAPLLWGNTATGFTADDRTWVQPSGTQDAAAITAILPSAMTDPPGLTASFVSSFTNGAISDVTPLVGSIATPGVLIDAVAAATCTAPNDTNKLLNPIDSTCITTDASGQPRWDTGNSARDIGGIQMSQSPFVAVTSVALNVGLSWNRPLDPFSGPITGYRVSYVPVAGGTPQTLDVLGPETTSTTISGLTLGTPYRFTVTPLNVVGPGTPSNEVQATPLGPVGDPVVSASGGDGLAQLSWTEPPLGGHPGPPTYTVVYRPTGTTTWIAGPGNLSARTTVLSGLTNGTLYELGVVATSPDGTSSQVGLGSVTPLGAPAAPTVAAVSGAPGTGQLDLTWTPPPDGGSPITSYALQCRAVGSSIWTTQPTNGIVTSVTVTGLEPGTRYECHVAASNIVGPGPWSELTAATPATGANEGLAGTGLDLLTPALLAASSLMVGLVLLTAARRRRSST